jgi:hypothetical protein
MRLDSVWPVKSHGGGGMWLLARQRFHKSSSSVYQRRSSVARLKRVLGGPCVDCGCMEDTRSFMVRVYEQRRITDFRYQWCPKCVNGFKWLLRDRCSDWEAQGLLWDGDRPIMVRSGTQ